MVPRSPCSLGCNLGRAPGSHSVRKLLGQGLGKQRLQRAPCPSRPWVAHPAPAGGEMFCIAKNQSVFFFSVSHTAELTPPGQIFVLSLCFTSQNLKLHSVFLTALKRDRHILTN